MRLLMIDNYDSFTYNLVQYLGELGVEVDVVRHDVEDVDTLLARQPQGLVISPGPGEMTMPSACRASSSETLSTSLRTTSTSAPSSPRYWTRL